MSQETAALDARIGGTYQSHPLWNCVSVSHPNESFWKADRETGIGASETASIFGVGYASCSPVTVWAEKTGNPEPVSPALQRLFDRGHRMESVIAAEVVAETGWEVKDTGDYTIFRSKDERFSRLFTTLDREVIHPDFGPCPMEMKNVHGRFWKDYEGDEAPLKHVVQCQHQMAVTGATHVVLAVLVGGADLKIFIVERNEQFIEAMVAKLDEFWGYVERREMPPVDESEATAKALARIYPEDDGETVDLPSEASKWDEDLEEIKARQKKVKEERTALENKIKAALGVATFGQLPDGGRFSWKLQKRSGYTVNPSQFRVLKRLKK